MSRQISQSAARQSTDDKIASVDADGKVTGLKNGTVTITAKATSPSKGTYVTKTKEIKVGTGVADIEPDGITVNYDFAVMNPDGQLFPISHILPQTVSGNMQTTKEVLLQ